MKVKVTKLDRFLDFMLTQGDRDLETWEIREGLTERRFWSDQEESKALNDWKDSQILQLLKKMPKRDEQGKVIERVHVVRKDEDGGKRDVHPIRLNLTFEDKCYAIQKHLDLGKYYYKEAARLYHDFLEESPANECRKLRRQFQGLLPIEGIDEDENDN